MRQIEGLLLVYDDLSDAERSEADLYLRKHPDAAERIAEGRRLQALLEATAPREVSEDDLAAVVVLRAYSGDEARLAGLEARLAAAFREDPELEARMAELEQRWETLANDLRPSTEHLAELRESTAAASARRNRPHQVHPAGDRPVRRSPRRSAVRMPVAALLIVGILFGSVYLASETSRPAHERAAALSQLPPPPPALRLRGADGVADRQTEAYVEAVETVRSARRSLAGLFVRYDETTLRHGLAGLSVTHAMNPGSAIGLEARFAMARVHLHVNEIEDARRALEEVVAQEGPSAPDARRLLEEMAARGIE